MSGDVERMTSDRDDLLQRERCTRPDAETASASLQGDRANIVFLIVLYVLQGLSLGIGGVVAVLMKERGASFSDLGTFELHRWPFCLKLLWAPLVDATYVKRFGRRKTWMLPVLCAIGLMLVGTSLHIDDFLDAEQPAVLTLTFIFFVLHTLCATQDIVVDGWALTLLRPENVGWASSCNVLGVNLGIAIGHTGYFVLEQQLAATFRSFMLCSGLVITLVSVLVALFKEERPLPLKDELGSIAASYKQAAAIVRLRPVLMLASVLITWQAAFPITDVVAPLKFMELGVPKEHLAYIETLWMPFSMLIPVVVARWTCGKTPLALAMLVYPLRICVVVATAVVVFSAPASTAPPSCSLYVMVAAVLVLNSCSKKVMAVSQGAFFARVSDPAIGGTYMSLLNSFCNIGTHWPPYVALKLVDVLTCEGRACAIECDGFFVSAVVCVAVGVLWYLVGAPVVRTMQEWELDEWRVR